MERMKKKEKKKERLKIYKTLWYFASKEKKIPVNYESWGITA